jgi:hypothetical protein
VRTVSVRPTEVGLPHVVQLLELTRQRTRKRDGTTTTGRRLFACTVALSPAEAARIVRARWAVENRNHHPRDATLLEDKTRCRTGHAAATLTLLRGFVLCWWRWRCPHLPAPAFLARNQRHLPSALRELHQPLAAP